MRVGFRFHSKDRLRYLRLLGCALFIFFMFSFFAILNGNPERMASLEAKLGVGAIIVLTIIAGILFLKMFLRTLESSSSAGLVLEFGDDDIIDRSFLRERRVPYSEIEIFSPPLDSIFRPDPYIRELRAELGTDDFLSVACRRKSSAGAPLDDYTFFQRVAPLRVGEAETLEAAIREKMSGRIGGYELLVQDFFDDETTAGFSDRADHGDR